MLYPGIEIIVRKRQNAVLEHCPRVTLGLQDTWNHRQLIRANICGVMLKLCHIKEGGRKNTPVFIPPELPSMLARHSTQRINVRIVITRVEGRQTSDTFLADTATTRFDMADPGPVRREQTGSIQCRFPGPLPHLPQLRAQTRLTCGRDLSRRHPSPSPSCRRPVSRARGPRVHPIEGHPARTLTPEHVCTYGRTRSFGTRPTRSGLAGKGLDGRSCRDQPRPQKGHQTAGAGPNDGETGKPPFGAAESRRAHWLHVRDPRDRATGPGHGHQRQGVDNAMNRIASLFTPLLRLLFPAAGRHRVTAPPLAVALREAVTPAAVAPLRTPVRPAAPLRGEDVALVRPYVLSAAERRECRERRERRLQRGRRRALWLAVHGVDVGPRRIHGVEVAA